MLEVSLLIIDISMKDIEISQWNNKCVPIPNECKD